MDTNYDACFKIVVENEGGFTTLNDEVCNHGVCKSAWEAWVGHKVSEQQIRDLKATDVYLLYRKYAWLGAACQHLPSGIDLMVFDLAISAGLPVSIRRLQSVLGIDFKPENGLVGPMTIIAAQNCDPVAFIRNFALSGERYARTAAIALSMAQAKAA